MQLRFIFISYISIHFVKTLPKENIVAFILRYPFKLEGAGIIPLRIALAFKIIPLTP